MLCFTAHSDSDGCRGSSCPWRYIPAAGGSRGVCVSLPPWQAAGDLLAKPHISCCHCSGEAQPGWHLSTDLTPKSPEPGRCQPPHLPVPPSSPGHFSRDLSQISLAVIYTHDLLPLPKGPLFPPLSAAFCPLGAQRCFFSLSPAFLSQNPPTFLTLCPSLVFPAQLLRALQIPSLHSPSCCSVGSSPSWCCSVPPAALFLLCCSRCLSLPSPSATSALGDGTQSSLPTLPGHPGALAAPSAAERRWSHSAAASVSPPVEQGQPLQAGMALAAGEGDRLGSFVAPHSQSCSHSMVLSSLACPRLIPDLLTHPHGCGAAHSWVRVAPFLGARHTQGWDAQRGMVNPLPPAQTRGWLSTPFLSTWIIIPEPPGTRQEHLYQPAAPCHL